MDRIFFVEVSVNFLCNLLYCHFVQSVIVGLLVKVLFLAYSTVDVLIDRFVVLFMILPEVTHEIF